MGGDDSTLSAGDGDRRNLTEVRPGDVLADRYEILAELGRGAFGVVYRAHDRVAGIDIAIKVLGGARRLSRIASERLRRELRAAWSVTHRGVLRIHDLIFAGDHIALSMELVEGETLDTYLEREHTVDEIRALATELADALAAAHVAGVTHRDLKPSNIMIRASGRAVITDLGLSRVSGLTETSSERAPAPSEALEIGELTRTGELLGTPAFMAPEQLQGISNVGPAADVYSLGLVLFQVATGQRVHPHENVRELMRLRLEQPAPRVATLRPELPTWFARIIDDCLLIAPTDRIADGVELARRLHAGAASRRRRRWPLFAIAPLLLGGLAIWFAYHRGSSLPDRDRRVVFRAHGTDDIDRALVGVATRALASDLHIHVVDATVANVTVDLAWRQLADKVEVSASIGERVVATGRGDSVVGAFGQARGQLTHVLDADQPIAQLDDERRSEMASLGARDVTSYLEYVELTDMNFRTTVIDAARIEERLTALVARDPSWAHPYALLIDIQGVATPAAEATRARALAATDAARDPSGHLVLQARPADAIAATERVSALDRAYAAAPTDLYLGWTLYQLLLYLHRNVEADAVIRTLYQRRPDLQFGSDVVQTLQYSGKSGEIDALQHGWLERAPESEQGWAARVDRTLASGHPDEALRQTRDLLLVFGHTSQHELLLADVAMLAGDFAVATTASTTLMRGDDYDRVLGWYSRGDIELLQGHFSAAREAWRTAKDRGQAFGASGLLPHSLEQLMSLDEVLGEPEELAQVAGELIEAYRQFGDEGRRESIEITRDGMATPRKCRNDLAELVRAYPVDTGRASFEHNIWRAAADVGCASCRDVVRLGGSPDELSSRSLYRFGVCAEQEGELELARDSFTRARVILNVVENSGTDPATAYSILADYHLGRVLARLGKIDDARAAYTRFLTRWGHADRPVHEVELARNELAALPH